MGYHSEFPAPSCPSILVNTSKVLGSWAMNVRNWANEVVSPRDMIGCHSLEHAEGEKRHPILCIKVLQKWHSHKYPIQKKCKLKHFRVKQSLGYHSEFPAPSCPSILVNTSKVLGSVAMSFSELGQQCGISQRHDRLPQPRACRGLKS